MKGNFFQWIAVPNVMRLLTIAAVATIVAVDSWAQQPRFEVASIKRNTTGGFAMSSQGGRFVATNVPVIDLVRVAYQLQPYQIIGAPAWAGDERYDIVANGAAGALVGPGTPVSLTQLMMRQLLLERFRLQSHTENREMPIYALVKSRNDDALGQRLEKSTIDCTTPQTSGPLSGPAPPPKPGERRPCVVLATPTSLAAGGVPLAQFALVLSPRVGRQVVDQTGLEGRFAFTLDFAPDALVGGGPAGPAREGSPPNAPSLFTAIEEQLGLKLQPSRGPVEVLVIDSVERPTPD